MYIYICIYVYVNVFTTVLICIPICLITQINSQKRSTRVVSKRKFCLRVEDKTASAERGVGEWEDRDMDLVGDGEADGTDTFYI